jgi:ADP-ribose pyrophosphatase
MAKPDPTRTATTKRAGAKVRKPKSTATRTARVLSSRVSYHGPVFTVTTEEVEEPGGVRARRDVVRHSGSIVILAVDKAAEREPNNRRSHRQSKSSGSTRRGASEPRILLERQYRHAAHSMMWELPAGRIDEGETPLTAAKRELIEETGFRAGRWKRILHFYVSPGFLDETMTIYLAEGLEAGDAEPEADERITTQFFSFSEAIQMALNGRIKDAKTISGILWLAQTTGGTVSRKKGK